MSVFYGSGDGGSGRSQPTSGRARILPCLCGCRRKLHPPPQLSQGRPLFREDATCGKAEAAWVAQVTALPRQTSCAMAVLLMVTIWMLIPAELVRGAVPRPRWGLTSPGATSPGWTSPALVLGLPRLLIPAAVDSACAGAGAGSRLGRVLPTGAVLASCPAEAPAAPAARRLQDTHLSTRLCGSPVTTYCRRLSPCRASPAGAAERREGARCLHQGDGSR